MMPTPRSWTASVTEKTSRLKPKKAELESCNNLAASAGSLPAISAMRWIEAVGDWSASVISRLSSGRVGSLSKPAVSLPSFSLASRDLTVVTRSRHSFKYSRLHGFSRN